MIALAPLYVATAFAFGMPQNVGCTVPENPPTYRVDVDVQQPAVDHTVPRNALKHFETATVSPYGRGERVHVNGLMRGAISTESQMSLGWQRTQDNSINCFWYESVSIKLSLRPTIFIAREIPQNSCSYREVLKHEMGHYQTDYNIARDYQVIFQQELDKFLKASKIVGPYARNQQEQAQRELSSRLEAVIRTVNERLNQDRLQRQARLDTREEYERVAQACAGQNDF